MTAEQSLRHSGAKPNLNAGSILGGILGALLGRLLAVALSEAQKRSPRNR